jgi:hypothetical protein
MAARLCRSTLLRKNDEEEATMPTIGVHDSTLYPERSSQDTAMPFIDRCGPDVWADESERLPLLHRGTRR